MHIVYYLSREGQLEQPHLLEVPVSTNSDEGLYLRDVKKRLALVRGSFMPASFSWSYKRYYKDGLYVWQDISDNDLIMPGREGEYVLKGSRIVLDNLGTSPDNNAWIHAMPPVKNSCTLVDDHKHLHELQLQAAPRQAAVLDDNVTSLDIPKNDLDDLDSLKSSDSTTVHEGLAAAADFGADHEDLMINSDKRKSEISPGTVGAEMIDASTNSNCQIDPAQSKQTDIILSSQDIQNEYCKTNLPSEDHTHGQGTVSSSYSRAVAESITANSVEALGKLCLCDHPGEVRAHEYDHVEKDLIGCNNPVERLRADDLIVQGMANRTEKGPIHNEQRERDEVGNMAEKPDELVLLNITNSASVSSPPGCTSNDSNLSASTISSTDSSGSGLNSMSNVDIRPDRESDICQDYHDQQPDTNSTDNTSEKLFQETNLYQDYHDQQLDTTNMTRCEELVQAKSERLYQDYDDQHLDTKNIRSDPLLIRKLESDLHPDHHDQDQQLETNNMVGSSYGTGDDQQVKAMIKPGDTIVELMSSHISSMPDPSIRCNDSYRQHHQDQLQQKYFDYDAVIRSSHRGPVALYPTRMIHHADDRNNCTSYAKKIGSFKPSFSASSSSTSSSSSKRKPKRLGLLQHASCKGSSSIDVMMQGDDRPHMMKEMRQRNPINGDAVVPPVAGCKPRMIKPWATRITHDHRHHAPLTSTNMFSNKDQVLNERHIDRIYNLDHPNYTPAADQDQGQLLISINPLTKANYNQRAATATDNYRLMVKGANPAASNDIIGNDDMELISRRKGRRRRKEGYSDQLGVALPDSRAMSSMAGHLMMLGRKVEDHMQEEESEETLTIMPRSRDESSTQSQCIAYEAKRPISRTDHEYRIKHRLSISQSVNYPTNYKAGGPYPIFGSERFSDCSILPPLTDQIRRSSRSSSWSHHPGSCDIDQSSNANSHIPLPDYNTNNVIPAVPSHMDADHNRVSILPALVQPAHGESYSSSNTLSLWDELLETTQKIFHPPAASLSNC